MSRYIVSVALGLAAFDISCALSIAGLASGNRAFGPLTSGIAAGFTFGVVFAAWLGVITGPILRWVGLRYSGWPLVGVIAVAAPLHVVAIWVTTHEPHETLGLLLKAWPHGEWALFLPACAAGVWAFTWHEATRRRRRVAAV